MKPTLLLVEAPGSHRELLSLSFQGQGWRVLLAAGVEPLVQALRESPPVHLVLAAGALLASEAGRLDALREALAASGASLWLEAPPAEQDALRRSGLPVAGFIATGMSLGARVEAVRQALPREAREAQGRQSVLRVLVVEDDPVYRKLLQLALAPFRFELMEAEDGMFALELARRHPPDIVLADVLMPRLDGFRLCLALRQDPKLARVPVILTHATSPDELDLRMAANVGANAFVRRSQGDDELVATLLRESRAEGPLPAPVPGELSTETHLYAMVRQLERRVGLLEQAERTARESEERYRLVVSGSYDGVWDWDVRNQRMYWSPRLLEMLGLKPEDFPGTSEAFLARVHPEDRDAVASALALHLEQGAPYDVSFRLKHEAGGYRSCVSRGRAIRDTQGRPVRMAGIIGDVTEQLRLYREAREAVRVRDEFLAVAAHELRTPLAALRLRVQGTAAALKLERQVAPERLERALVAADRQVQRLADLVEGLLDVSQMQSHAPRLNLEAVDLGQVVRDVVLRSEELASRAGCLLVVRDVASAVGHWDALRLGQVVTHLLVNAVKFGPGKPVELEVQADESTAWLVVRDHGIGIAPDRVDGLFRRFERAVPARNYGGLGLGLYRLSRIVEAHGGEVAVTSTLGQGATFRVRLPRAGPPVGHA
ncbi:response regulator [Corallococcus sp. AB032C]|uniref:sensor histidine kinase n=1 Tax=Corallococcus TaxID=83461 RepID=UPI000EEE5D97|nr:MULTISPECIES: ATP-binding protein [Corallococcus]NPC49223.1 PAS domain-containing protein [Corallococcus exiguus]RKH82972.1 response regulator [Corallococcus sp. AB032C]